MIKHVFWFANKPLKASRRVSQYKYRSVLITIAFRIAGVAVVAPIPSLALAVRRPLQRLNDETART